MPDAVPLTGLYGKVPAHGDFVRRGLPTSFVGPWDSWLQTGMAEARERLGDRWPAVWDGAPAWRFALPAGACGPDAVAGVLLPSEDMVGRRFPITLAALLPPGGEVPAPTWFAVLEAAAHAGRAGRVDADGLAAAIPAPDAELPEVVGAPASGALDPLAVVVPDDDEFDRAWAAAPLRLAGAEGIPEDEGVLGLLGGSAVEPGAAADEARGLPSQGDSLSRLHEPLDPAAEPAAMSADDDVLGLLTGAVTTKVPTPPPEPVPSDGTLAFLLGEGSAESESSAALLPGGASEGPETGSADLLATLIASGEASPMTAPSDEMPASLSTDATPRPDEHAPSPAILVPAEAPEAPAGGGWWTGGGGRVPASVRPLAALPPPAEFVSLLEADA